MIVKRHWFLGTIFLMCLLTACSPRQVMIKEMTFLLDNGLERFEKDSDTIMLEQALPAHIKLAESLLDQAKEKGQLRILLARMYGAHAFAFEATDFEAVRYDQGKSTQLNHRPINAEEMRQRLSRHFIKGAEYAKSVLALKHTDVAKSLSNITLREAFLGRLTQEDIPALFWYGFNLGGYVSYNLDSVRALAMATQVEAVMRRVIAVSPDYYHGTAHLVLMLSQASRPRMMGGNLEQAIGHYHQVKSIAGDRFLLADLFYARYCLPQKQDRSEFEQVLSQIANTDIRDSDPFALLNQVAVRRAQIYLNTIDYLFEG